MAARMADKPAHLHKTEPLQTPAYRAEQDSFSLCLCKQGLALK